MHETNPFCTQGTVKVELSEDLHPGRSFQKLPFKNVFACGSKAKPKKLSLLKNTQVHVDKASECVVGVAT